MMMMMMMMTIIIIIIFFVGDDYYDGDKKCDGGNGCNNCGDEECVPRTQTIDRHGHPGLTNSSNSKNGDTKHNHFVYIIKDIYVNM